ncbi:MAG: tRNA(Ile)-lysidine synthase, partial [Parcubacteria group bacterium GW2011_GWC2_38_7]
TIAVKDIKALKKKLRTSTQATARQARMDFLSKLKKKNNAAKIAIGHTLDDRAETVLINLIKGSGGSGIAGMDFYNRRMGIVRPLLSVTRKEVEKYLKEKRVEFINDSSNYKKIYLRNKIRLELIPLLEKGFNPQIKRRLADTAQILSMEDDYLEEQALKNLESALIKNFDSFSAHTSSGKGCVTTPLSLRATPSTLLRTGSGSVAISSIKGIASVALLPRNDIAIRPWKREADKVVLNIDFIKSLPFAITYRIIRKAMWRLKSDIKGLSFSHVDKVFSLMREGKTGSSLNLPGKIRVRKVYNELVFSKSIKKKDFPAETVKLALPGETKLPFLRKTLNALVLPRDSVKFIVNDKRIGIFDFEKIETPVIVRTKKNGDRFTPFGMKGSKKLKDFFIDRKIPGENREKIPLLLSCGEIIWVVGERISDKFKVTQSTKEVLLVGLV